MNKQRLDSFDPNMAMSVGIVPAIIINYLRDKIVDNYHTNSHQHDGRTWTRQRICDICDAFPYLSYSQVTGATKKIVNLGICIKGNHNDHKLDNSSWYAFVDEAKFNIGSCS